MMGLLVWMVCFILARVIVHVDSIAFLLGSIAMIVSDEVWRQLPIKRPSQKPPSDR